MVDYPDIINYTRDELLEEFCKLFDRYHELKESNEADTQKIHELKRSLDTATAAQAYLSQELEQYTNAECNQDEKELQKTTSELLEMKKRYSKLEVAFNTLQQDHNTLLEENAVLTQHLEEARRKDSEPAIVESKSSEDDLQRIQMLEYENLDLLQKMEDFQEQTVRYTLTIAEFEKNIEILRDQINCLEENLQSKKTDLDEKVQILESTQEQLAEANAQIAMLSDASENSDRKGNSLFSEVDDQRQVMKQLLTSQKKSYMQMKKIYNESEHEIRRLKRENIAMHTELKACSSIFCNADKVYQEKLNERVRHLLNQNDDLECKLKWTQERLKELASEKGLLWLDSMLNFCKKETDDLKKQLHSVRIQNASLEEHLRNSQQDLARWRFESLKSRCLLLDREQLLTENKIDFKPSQDLEFHIPQKEQNEARPRIVSTRRSSILENVTRKSMTPQKYPKDENTSAVPEEADNKVEIINAESNNPEVLIIKTETCDSTNSDLEKKEPSDAVNEPIAAPPPTDEEILSEEKENCMPSKGNYSKLIAPQPPSPMRPSQKLFYLLPADGVSTTPPARSILSKQRDFLSKEPCKIVKFSSKEDLIHSFTPDSPSPASNASSISASSNKDENVASSTTPIAKGNSKAVVKQTRKKSNIVVRRVFVGSKHD